MNPKYMLVAVQDGVETRKEYKTLKDISTELGIEVHLIRKINDLTEQRLENIKAHKRHKELYDNYKIYDIKREIKKI